MNLRDEPDLAYRGITPTVEKIEGNPWACEGAGDFPKITRADQVQYSPCMCVDIYRTKRSNTFLLVPRGANLSVVPHEILTSLGQLVCLSTRDLSEPLLRPDSTEINSELANQGVFSSAGLVPRPCWPS